MPAQRNDATIPVSLGPQPDLAALDREYAEMARDEQAEAEAIEWIEAVIADIPDDPW